MTLEHRITTAVRLTVMIGLGLVFGFGTTYAVGRKMAAWLGFDERFQSKAAAAAVVLTLLVALTVFVVRLFQSEQEPAPKEQNAERDVAPLWKHSTGHQAELGVWYECCRKGPDGMFHSTTPEGPFTGIVRTNANSFLYLENSLLPSNAALWMMIDESKFVSVLERVPSEDEAAGRHYLVELSTHERFCCIREFNHWVTEDGKSIHYWDWRKQVVRWLPIETSK